MRRPFIDLPSFAERVTAFAQEALEAAEALPPGPEKEELLKKAHRAQAAKNMDAWANGELSASTYQTGK
jgi:hypothetical protein